MRLALCLVMTMVALRAHAMGEADRVDVVVLSLSDGAGAGVDGDATSGLERLAWELEKRTSIAVAPHPVPLPPGDPALRRHPLLALHGKGSLPPLDERALDAVRAHLEAGGLLFVDAADPDDAAFDRDVRSLARRLFPRASLAPLPPSHVFYKTFYLLDAPVGRVDRYRTVEAVLLDGRIVMLYSRNDVLGALARDRLGAFLHAVAPGGEPQREMALRFGINLVMYALCLDYKADQVHTPFLLQRRHGQ